MPGVRAPCDPFADPSEPRTRVLVVEDQEVIREAIAAAFEREPCVRINEAGSLSDARAMLNGVDIAILDLGLPDGNGADLIQEITAVNPGATAIVSTSSLDPNDADEALVRGAAAVFSKLDELDELLAMVRRLQRSASP